MEYCDLVMKGGITSGVVYPLAVVELARKYHFKNIGGTSAGAVAAAATAAAEYRRRHGSDEGFEELKRLPELLARDGFLFSLFQPDRTTKPLFGIALGLLKARGAPAIVATVLRGLVTGYPAPTLAGAALGAIVPALAWYLGFASPGAAFALGWLWMALFAIVAAAIAAGRDVPTLLRRNWFGLCSGFSATAAAGQAPLTNWLHGYLDAVAGKSSGGPLTFGDLWTAPQTNDPLQTERAVHLEMLTTNLTHGRPYSLPFRDAESRQFFFSPEEWARVLSAGGDRASAGACGALSHHPAHRRGADALAASRHGGAARCRRGADEPQFSGPVRRCTALGGRLLADDQQAARYGAAAGGALLVFRRRHL